MSDVTMRVPQHIGLILDGNRRFSKRLMLKPWKGHEWGAKKVAELLDWAGEYDVKELTLYAFSIENFNRPKEEFDYLMKLFIKEFKNTLDDERVHAQQIRINFIGRIHLFPAKVKEAMQALSDKTKGYSKRIVNFAMAYGGRSEVVDAARKIAEQVRTGKLTVEQINEEVFQNSLYTPSEPDLIIRTGGEQRMSNFLLYQGAYSEWIFLQKMWPEFSKEDFAECIQEYGRRERRFGR